MHVSKFKFHPKYVWHSVFHCQTKCCVFQSSIYLIFLKTYLSQKLLQTILFGWPFSLGLLSRKMFTIVFVRSFYLPAVAIQLKRCDTVLDFNIKKCTEELQWSEWADRPLWGQISLPGDVRHPHVPRAERRQLSHHGLNLPTQLFGWDQDQSPHVLLTNTLNTTPKANVRTGSGTRQLCDVDCTSRREKIWIHVMRNNLAPCVKLKLACHYVTQQYVQSKVLK